MSVLETLQNFTKPSVVEEKLADIEQQKIGYLCAYVPEEIIVAAGMSPYRITGSVDEDLSQADAYIPMSTCGFCRAALVEGLKNGTRLFSGMVTADGCDSMRRLFDTWDYYVKTPFNHIMWVPHKATPPGEKAFLTELVRLKEGLEEFTGNAVTYDDLNKAIAQYNQTRDLLEKIYASRLGENPAITGTEALEVVKAGFVLPREEYNKLLTELLEEIDGRNAYDEDGPRILVTGSICADMEYVRVIEDGGGRVVADDICTGARYFDGRVEEDTADPLTALAQRYINRFPCARMYDYKLRFDNIVEQIEKYDVQGVIYSVLKFCDPYQYDYPIFRDRLEEMELPLLKIDREHDAAGIGQISTRVQAFLEMIF